MYTVLNLYLLVLDFLNQERMLNSYTRLQDILDKQTSSLNQNIFAQRLHFAESLNFSSRHQYVEFNVSQCAPGFWECVTSSC